MGRRKQFTIEMIKEAIKAANGLTYTAARKLGCSHTTIENAIREDPSVRAVLDEERGLIDDEVESRLLAAIRRDEHWALSLWATTRMKHRGFTKRQELTGAGGEKLSSVQIFIPDNGRGDRAEPEDSEEREPTIEEIMGGSGRTL